MDITARQYRIVEMTRHKNQREQRRLEQCMASKHGLIATHNQEMKAMKRETVQVQRELDKINKGYPYIKRMADYSKTSNEANSDKNETDTHINSSYFQSMSEPQESFTPRSKQFKDNVDKNGSTPRRLYKTTGGNQQMSPRQSKQFKDNVDKNGLTPRRLYKTTGGNQQMSPRQRPRLAKAKSKPKNLSITKRSSLLSGDEKNDLIIKPIQKENEHDSVIDVVDAANSTKNGVSESKDPAASYDMGSEHSSTRSPRRVSRTAEQPIGEISISDAKENIAKRLLSSKTTSSHSDGAYSYSPRPSHVSHVSTSPVPAPIDPLPQFPVAEDPFATSGIKDTQNVTTVNVKNSKVQKKGFDEMLRKMSFDSDTYNPDGTLRTVHTMTTFEHRYEQAKKARYVRHRDKPDFERELSVSQIFEGMSQKHNV